MAQETTGTTVAQKPRAFKATTIDVDEDRWRRLKSEAALRGVTVKVLLDDLLGDFLGEPIN